MAIESPEVAVVVLLGLRQSEVESHQPVGHILEVVHHKLEQAVVRTPVLEVAHHKPEQAVVHKLGQEVVRTPALEVVRIPGQEVAHRPGREVDRRLQAVDHKQTEADHKQVQRRVVRTRVVVEEKKEEQSKRSIADRRAEGRWQWVGAQGLSREAKERGHLGQ